MAENNDFCKFDIKPSASSEFNYNDEEAEKKYFDQQAQLMMQWRSFLFPEGQIENWESLAKGVYDKDTWEKSLNTFKADKILLQNGKLSDNEFHQKYSDEIINGFQSENPSLIAQQLYAFQKNQRYPEQQQNLHFLNDLMQDISSIPNWQYAPATASEPEKNKFDLVTQEKNGQISNMLRVKNLGGSGLCFALEDGKSIVLARDQQLTKKQIQNLSAFFKDTKLEISDFEQLKNIQVKDGEKGETFADIYKTEQSEQSAKSCQYYVENYNQEQLQQMLAKEDNSELKEVLMQAVEQSKEIQQQPETEIDGVEKPNQELADNEEDHNSGESFQNEGIPADSRFYDNNPGFDNYLDNAKGKKITYRSMREALKARAGIMEINPKCVVSHRMADGSMVISFYPNEQAIGEDGKLDKDGNIKHTKKVAFKCTKNPPTVGIYVPDGGEFKAAYIKGALSACGQPYFIVPSAVEFGGKAVGASMEAAGDALKVPILKTEACPDGFEMKNDNLAVLLKSMQDKNAGNTHEILQFKMRLIQQLSAQFAYQEKQHKSIDSKLNDSLTALKGDVRCNYLPDMKDYFEGIITEGINKKGWNVIDTACATMASAEIIKMIEKGVFTYKDANGNIQTQNVDLLDVSKNNRLIDTILVQQMGENRAEVEKKFKSIAKGTDGDEDDGEEHTFSKNSIQSFSSAGKQLVQWSNGIYKQALKEISDTYSGSRKVEKLSSNIPNCTITVKIGERGREFENLSKGEPDLSHIGEGTNAADQYRRSVARGRNTRPVQQQRFNTGR